MRDVSSLSTLLLTKMIFQAIEEKFIPFQILKSLIETIFLPSFATFFPELNKLPVKFNHNLLQKYYSVKLIPHHGLLEN